MKLRVSRRSLLSSLLSVTAIASAVMACGGSENPPPASANADPNAPPAWSIGPDAGPQGPPEPRRDPNLIPREALFGNREFASPMVSPDGKWLAFQAPVAGVMNVLVVPSAVPIDLGSAKAVTHDRARPISEMFWSHQPGVLLYMQDTGGDENDHVYAVDVTTGDSRDLTPFKGARSGVIGLSAKHPKEALIQTNDRDPKWADVYRVDLTSGKRTLVQKNDKELGDFRADDDFQVRLATHTEKDGSLTVLGKGKTGAFDDTFLTVPFDDAESTHLAGFDSSGHTLYMVDSRDRDTAALTAVDMATKKAKVLAQDDRADVNFDLLDPRTHVPLIASSEYLRKKDVVLDPKMKSDLDYLARVVPDADIDWGSCSTDFKLCTVLFGVSDSTYKWYLYNRTTKTVTFLSSTRPKLDKVKLAKMLAQTIPARDGLALPSYLTLPAGSDADGNGIPDKPLPMVLVVHGGPWGRDTWGMNGQHQWLANRGYAVLSVNFRASEGLGKKFLNAGNLEWGAKMQDDLTDAVKWAESAKIADPGKVAIFGGSYGGYATLAGLTTTPDLYACGVDFFGVANLITIQASIPPYWESMRAMLAKRIGDPSTDEGKKFLLSRSPTSHVEAIKKPLLIGQGANDVRVKPAESEQIVNAMKAKGLPVTYFVFSDEGHGFYRPENSEAAYAVSETFLAQYLGGAYQPIEHSFDGSTITVPTGAEQVFGLVDALKVHAAQQKDAQSNNPSPAN